jgi:hypothetical protein
MSDKLSSIELQILLQKFLKFIEKNNIINEKNNDNIIPTFSA